MGVRLGKRFEEAVGYALQVHGAQVRKGSEVPYAAHLLAVASLVLEHGGDEETVIAALLHDAVEDHGERGIGEEIRRRFGERVAEIVAGCSDAAGEPKPAWRARKERHLERMKSAGESVLLVTAADKLHNARCLVADYRQEGEGLWGRFRGGREGTLWYYRSMAAVLAGRVDERLTRALSGAIAELEQLATQ